MGKLEGLQADVQAILEPFRLPHLRQTQKARQGLSADGNTRKHKHHVATYIMHAVDAGKPPRALQGSTEFD